VISIRQESLRAQLLSEAGETDARIAELYSAVGDQRLQWQPPGGGWSIGQVLEHLCIASDAYLDRMVNLIDAPGARHIVSPDHGWRPRLGGRLLVKSLSSGRNRLPAPRILRPGPTPRADVYNEFMRRETTLRELLERAALIDWQRTRLTSPASSLFRLNLGDAFRVLVVHARRHLGQMERVRAHPEFPPITPARV
jgi:hypothetical protein